MEINYLAEIIAFERWLETNYLPISSQLLWYKMMNLFNRSGWSEWVIVDNLRLMAAMQMGREATLIKARDDLIKAGRIVYQKGKKGSPNRYKIVLFTCKSVVQRAVKSEVYSEVNRVVKSAVESVDIYKHKQKLNQKKDTNVSKEIGELEPEDVEPEEQVIPAHTQALFEYLWTLYPEKKGKAAVSDTQRGKILKIGKAQMERAIDRYKTELEKDKDWRQPQNGGTFFNKGYVDYLDDNFKPSEKKPEKAKSKNGFYNLEEHGTDYEKVMWDIVRRENDDRDD